ncbi:hypothetical protein ACFX12_013380 [Malus domestica]
MCSTLSRTSVANLGRLKRLRPQPRNTIISSVTVESAREVKELVHIKESDPIAFVFCSQSAVGQAYFLGFDPRPALPADIVVLRIELLNVIVTVVVVDEPLLCLPESLAV